MSRIQAAASVPSIDRSDRLPIVLRELRSRLEAKFVRVVVVNKWGIVEAISPSMPKQPAQTAAWPPMGRCW